MSHFAMRRCYETEFETIWTIINDGAKAYHGHIPEDCLHDPYMSREELQREISLGVQFWGYEEEETLVGVMGIQDVLDVSLIRHAYVSSKLQHKGIGSKMLSHLCQLARAPLLVGTWTDAVWAVRFYENHGFRTVDP